jgi:hypothetical protein
VVFCALGCHEGVESLLVREEREMAVWLSIETQGCCFQSLVKNICTGIKCNFGYYTELKTMEG